MSEKDSVRESFDALHKRLEQSVELFHSLRNENSQLRSQIVALEVRMKALASAQSKFEGEVAKLLDERKLVRDKIEKILQALSLLESKTLG